MDDGTPYVIQVRSEDNDMEIHMKWDGCIDLRTYSNGSTPDDYSEENICYIHICDVKEFIKKLQDITYIAEQNFRKDNFEDYWM